MFNITLTEEDLNTALFALERRVENMDLFARQDRDDPMLNATWLQQQQAAKNVHREIRQQMLEQEGEL